MIRRLIVVESGANRKAVSSKGAQGLMQLTPQSVAELKRLSLIPKQFDPFDRYQNIQAGTALLQHYRDTVLPRMSFQYRGKSFSYNQLPKTIQAQILLASYNRGPNHLPVHAERFSGFSYHKKVFGTG